MLTSHSRCPLFSATSTWVTMPARSATAVWIQALDLHTLYTTGQKHYEAGRWREALDCFHQIQER
jgi:outer membrane protein assembly factor BamD (BamD/ComL family)